MGFNPFEAVGYAAAATGSFLQKKGSEAVDAAGKGLEQVAKAAGDGAAQAAKTAEEAAGAIGGAAQEAAKRLADTANEAGKNATGAADDAAGKLAAAANKVGEGIAQAGNKAVEVFQNDVAPALQNGAMIVISTADQLATDAKKALFKPIRRELAESDAFVLPQMIEVLSATNKRSVDLEFDAIGWKSTEGKIEVLHIYEDALEVIRCELYPATASKVGSIYYVDQLNARRYINLAKYLDVIAEEKKAELLNIAYRLGAKHCHLECREEKLSVKSGKMSKKQTLKFNVEGVPVKTTQQGEVDATHDKYDATVTLFSQEYSGNDTPQRPELHWYEHDPKILQLIEARCDESNELKCYRVEISDTQTVTFDLNAAINIDIALKKLKAATNFKFEGQARNEKRRKLTFVVEF